MTEIQKETSSEKEKSQKSLSGDVAHNNEVEVNSLQKALGKQVTKGKKDKAPEKPLRIIEDKNITMGMGSTESTVGEGKSIVTSETSGLTIKKGKDFSASAGFTTIVGENGQGNIEQEKGTFGITLTKKF